MSVEELYCLFNVSKHVIQFATTSWIELSWPILPHVSQCWRPQVAEGWILNPITYWIVYDTLCSFLAIDMWKTYIYSTPICVNTYAVRIHVYRYIRMRTRFSRFSAKKTIHSILFSRFVHASINPNEWGNGHVLCAVPEIHKQRVQVPPSGYG